MCHAVPGSRPHYALGVIKMCLTKALERATGAKDLIPQGLTDAEKLNDCLGQCDLIKSTPFNTSLKGMMTLFTWVHLALFPLTVVADIEWLTPVVSLLVAWMYLGLQWAGSHIEIPFFDLDLDQYCANVADMCVIEFWTIRDGVWHPNSAGSHAHLRDVGSLHLRLSAMAGSAQAPHLVTKTALGMCKLASKASHQDTDSCDFVNRHNQCSHEASMSSQGSNISKLGSIFGATTSALGALDISPKVETILEETASAETVAFASHSHGQNKGTSINEETIPIDPLSQVLQSSLLQRKHLAQLEAAGTTEDRSGLSEHQGKHCGQDHLSQMLLMERSSSALAGSPASPNGPASSPLRCQYHGQGFPLMQPRYEATFEQL